MGKFIDLTGQRFGKLIVVKRGKSQTTLSGRLRTIWECVCDCGEITFVRGDHLKNGRTKSCGCICGRPELHEDLTGKVFGRLTVVGKDLERTTCYSYPYWLCKCECGKIISVLAKSLVDEWTKSCGCLSADMASERRWDDLTDQRFGRLIVLKLHEVKRFPSGGTVLIWKCQCDCGNIFYVQAGSLRNGHTQSCGCYNRDRLRETHKGENNWNWKGGITPLTESVRKCTQYDHWRKGVFNRDDYICQYSGIRGHGNLNAHHKKPFHTILEENNITTMEQALVCDELWDLDNGDTLSKESHIDFHFQYSYTYSPEDYLQWLGKGA